MSGRQTIRAKCEHTGCPEIAYWDRMNMADYRRHAARLREHPWRCVRHTRPETVIGVDNPERVVALVAERSARYPELTKLFWREEGTTAVSSGFISGPGFKAFADDFPKGTRLTITIALTPTPRARGRRTE